MQEEELPGHEELGKRTRNQTVETFTAQWLHSQQWIMPLQISLWVFNMHRGSNYHYILDPTALHLQQLLTTTMKVILGTN